MTSLLGFSPAGAAGLGGLGLGGTTGFAGLGTGVGGQSFLLGGPGLARAGLGGITLNTALSTGCPVPGIGFCPFFTASPFTSTFPAAGGTLGLSASPSFLGGGLLGGGLLGGALTIPGTGNTVIVVR
jgi:hypothetical protein